MNTKIHFNNVEDAIDTVNKAAESNEAITKPINTSEVVYVSGLFKDDTSSDNTSDNTSDKLGKLNLF